MRVYVCMAMAAQLRGGKTQGCHSGVRNCESGSGGKTSRQCELQIN